MISTMEVRISEDRLKAFIHLEDETAEIGKEDVEAALQGKGVTHGLRADSLAAIEEQSASFPVCIAEGSGPVHGEDGYISFDIDLSVQKGMEDKENFREIMNIPSVHEGEKLGTIHQPTLGEKGRDVYGEEISPRPGKPSRIRPGKNITFESSTGNLYADIDGQVSYDEVRVSVQPVYQVDGDIDMKTGNLEFVGSIVISGDVPTGYTLKSDADITVRGLVEGAFLEAKGSIYIEGGVSGMGKCLLKAGVDVKASYINQGNVEAGQDIIVERSIVHSECVAKRYVLCSNGGIIGGNTSSGLQVKSKEIGNRMNTPTSVYMGVNKKIKEKLEQYDRAKTMKEEEKQKLLAIGEKLVNLYKQKGVLTDKQKALLHKQRNSSSYIDDDLQAIEEELKLLNDSLGNIEKTSVLVDQTLYSNVQIGFGKYERQLKSEQKHVHIYLEKGEIKIMPRS
ncbi:DUF342 domain-containing protein [Salimicrobium halophilum]|uniref:Flagellar Assembly Protein A N-terminal region domain-containing protein n=1 Tax=Salimicrobium halophilum TaxID=86666 RepID=A0A1G8Q959_9BACI|nr:FapA family protein [Salimicrobium halophilum]SDJ01359.1 hypothetical protein SAMN04490247_0479 [Salimicrobium halophilum]